jgi:hypothetical protein
MIYFVLLVMSSMISLMNTERAVRLVIVISPLWIVALFMAIVMTRTLVEIVNSRKHCRPCHGSGG